METVLIYFGSALYVFAYIAVIFGLLRFIYEGLVSPIIALFHSKK